MTVKVPAIKNFADVRQVLNDMSREMDNAKDRTLSNETANHSILLQAPDKSVWQIVISNTGVLTTSKVG